jgi:hypothetical protein
VDDGPIRIAVEERHDHFLADARKVLRAPPGPGPRLRHAHPARRLLVALAQAIPIELHHHAAELVGPNLLARGADHQRGLRAGMRGLRRRALGTELVWLSSNWYVALNGSSLPATSPVS